MPSFVKGYLDEHGWNLINKRDSAGNRLIHNVCMALSDEDSEILSKILELMMSASFLAKEGHCEEFVANMLEVATAINFA